MIKLHHPKDRLERKRSAEARALERLRPQRINGKKRKIKVSLEEKESQDELAHYRDLDLD